MIVSFIVAMSENRVIGRDNQLPWHISEDLKRFKRLTLGHPIIMGRKTFDSLGKPLPKRRNIVITRNQNLVLDGAEICQSLDDALELVKDEPEVFVIGGAEIFKMAMPLANKIYLTVVHKNVDGDVYLPEIPSDFFEVTREKHVENDISFSFVDLERK